MVLDMIPMKMKFQFWRQKKLPEDFVPDLLNLPFMMLNRNSPIQQVVIMEILLSIKDVYA